MKLLLLFGVLCVAASAQVYIEEGADVVSPFPDEIDPEDNGTIEVMTTDEDDDDDDDVPTTPPMHLQSKFQCKRKFWACRRQVYFFDCNGKLKCYEEMSRCYKAYKAAVRPAMMQRKSPAKMACKTKFDKCYSGADGTCRSKLGCYMAKQRCYMRMKAMDRRRHHHHRRRGHRHHRRRPCPKMMECKREWAHCIRRSRSCADRLACFWKSHKCMEKSCPTPTPPLPVNGEPPTTPKFERRWGPRRRWNPKVVAKCKANFEQCINSTQDCRRQIGCFIGLKRCIMEGHRPTPCPKMMKCKMEFKNCTNTSKTCEEKLACMYRKHECYERIRPTSPPPQNGSEDQEQMFGYRRRPRWNPKLKEKCKKHLHRCLNTSDSCMDKMKCFFKMKKCMMPPRMNPHHIIKMKLKQTWMRVKNVFGNGVKLFKKRIMWRPTSGRKAFGWREKVSRGAKRFGMRMKQKMQQERLKWVEKMRSMRKKLDQWKKNKRIGQWVIG